MNTSRLSWAGVGTSCRAIRKSCIAAALASLLLLFAGSAFAFIDPPYLTPEQPVAGDTVSVNIRGGICDSILWLPGYPQIVQQGQTIRIVFWSASSDDPILCYYPIATATYALGVYGAGAYSLQVDRQYFGDLGGILTETLGVVPFTVAGGGLEPVEAPALSELSLGTLALGVAIVAFGACRRRAPWRVMAPMLSCVLFAPTARAFIDPPYLTPEHPIAGDVVSVNIRSGMCDAVGTIPGYPSITREGNAVRILLWSVSNIDPILCNYPPGTGTYAVGTFDAGSYTLQVDRRYFGDLGGVLTETLGVIPFTVTAAGSEASAVPAVDGMWCSVLILGVTGVVLLTGSSIKLGYAYAASNANGDGLPDGFENTAGTSPTLADSDGDGISDSLELPLSGVPISDPCGGGTGALNCPADHIFGDGFDGF